MIIRYRKTTLLSLAALFALFFSAMPTPLAAISYYELESPFDSGTRWHICQGYNNTAGTHSGSSAISLDITGGPNCDSSAAGANVRSPLSGTVSWYVEASGSMCITANGSNRSVMLTHIDDSVTRGTTVSAGSIIGKIAAPHQRQNNGSAHLHIQAWPRSNCSPAGQSVPFSKANNMKICGAPDMPLNGPHIPGIGTWGRTVFTARSCAPDPAPEVPGADAVYRFWSPLYKHHFFTSSYSEMKSIYDSYDEHTWSYENYAFYAPRQSESIQSMPVHRFWSDQYRGHFYTSSEAEKQHIITSHPSTIWRYEGIAYHAYDQQNTESDRAPIYRFWSQTYEGHFYTASKSERDEILANYPDAIWRYEGIAFWSHQSADL